MERDEQIRLFKERAEAVQTSVTDVGGWQQAFLYALEVTKNQGGSTIAAPALRPEERSQLAELCRQAEITLLTENIRNHIGKIQTGLTLVDWGIAETATLVLDSSAEDLRIATMLSETHVAVLPRSRIKPDALALEPTLNAMIQTSPGYLAFISGASRTADIERVLTIGVHGPQELHILILEEADA
jgi:L-lactate dehydrogenase complex protein LldG